MTNAPREQRPAHRLEIFPDVWIDSRLALWLSALRILVVADLHWGYAASHRAQGNLLPAWGDAEIAGRLGSLVRNYRPAEMIWLGDSVHALTGAAAADEFLRNVAVPVTVVAGNHDARWSRAKDHVSDYRAPYFFHHGDQPRQVPAGAIEVIGHHHPAIAWNDGAGTRVKVPALVASERRLVLPAFSPWAGGVPWRPGSPGEMVYAISPKRIFTVSPAPEKT